MRFDKERDEALSGLSQQVHRQLDRLFTEVQQSQPAPRLLECLMAEALGWGLVCDDVCLLVAVVAGEAKEWAKKSGQSGWSARSFLLPLFLDAEGETRACTPSRAVRPERSSNFLTARSSPILLNQRLIYPKKLRFRVLFH